MKIFDDDMKVDGKRDWLKMTDLENFFDIFEDSHGYNLYNLNSSIYLLTEDSILPEYKLTYDMQWSLISYKLYKTTRLAWLLLKVNKVDAKDVFKTIQAGETVKYLDESTVQAIVSKINEFSET